MEDDATPKPKSSLPELPKEALLRIDAAIEKCDALAAAGNYAEAAVRYLDAQAEEYMPLVPTANDWFVTHTLPALVKTAIGMYGNAEAVEGRASYWRARWSVYRNVQKDCRRNAGPT